MKKILSLLVISVLMCSPVAIAADMQSETRGPMSGSEPIERSDDTGQISKLRSFLSDLANNYRDIPEARNNELKDGSERLLLYPTFNAPEAAFEAAAELYKSSFSDRPDFPAELNVTNWREVQKLVYLDGFDSDINLALLEFFDIYENIDDNVNISRAFDDPRSTGDSLELLLPDVQNVGSVSVRAVPRSYNRRNAVAYANKHATNRNRGYQSFSYDCTNFVSQVLRLFRVECGLMRPGRQ
ncbi:amidase domain-containing protein [Bowdeniella nasicola]|uniref:amidase domain-containing protein n=1 Tax=Bowdeniella nasicola TaxID=208480 RepID=UPI00130150FD|nr:amidase domain-containing protein [Bowdeniella nasicola]